MSTQKGEETDMCQAEEQHVERSRQRFGVWGWTPWVPPPDCSWATRITLMKAVNLLNQSVYVTITFWFRHSQFEGAWEQSPQVGYMHALYVKQLDCRGRRARQHGGQEESQLSQKPVFQVPCSQGHGAASKTLQVWELKAWSEIASTPASEPQSLHGKAELYILT